MHKVLPRCPAARPSRLEETLQHLKPELCVLSPERQGGTSPQFFDVDEFAAAFTFGYRRLDGSTRRRLSTPPLSLLAFGLVWRFTRTTLLNAHGNSNCRYNGGLIKDTLAVLGEDTTSTATRIFNYTIPLGRHVDRNGQLLVLRYHVSCRDSLFTPHRPSSSCGLLDSNPSFALTGLYHIYVSGSRRLFDYQQPGACSGTAPPYPERTGTIEGLTTASAMPCTSWLDINGWYVAMKAGALASYGNLGGGDFDATTALPLFTKKASSRETESDRWFGRLKVDECQALKHQGSRTRWRQRCKHPEPRSPNPLQ
ncbi:hypothetical protein M407DRAFT_23613 [Tulasnella calospora MUT 4182]|uniref:Uncharacterized protein n=1 Tax=Tulasnella calospora MUT 4182 TaxID=1051891 RepID=A0A0C3QKS6_9AGAM|nr:hypothetical protein M407DRAFT_23613 [Tulasnella calospora MUT 4182]